MKACRTIWQMKALLGLAMLLFVSLSSQAAPICSQVFHRQDIDVEAVIQLLAPLKIQIDNSQAQGSGQDVVMKLLSSEFSRHWNELLANSDRSPESLKELLRDRIMKLQNQENHNAEREQTQRQAQHEAIEALLPQARKSVALPFELREHKPSKNPRMVFIEHFEDTRTLLLADRDGHLMKSNGGVLSPLQVSSFKGAYGRVPDRNEVMHVSEGGKVWLLSSEGKVIKVLGEISADQLKRMNNPIGDSNIVVNPSGDKFALLGNNDVVFFDVASGHSWNLSFKKAVLNGPVHKVIFDNNNDAMVYTVNIEKNIEMLLVDLKNKDIDIVEPIEMLNEVIARSEKQETIYITDEMNSTGGWYFQLSSFSTKTNATRNLFAIPNKVNYLPHLQAQEIPNTNLIILNRSWKGENTLEIFDLVKQKSVYQFEEINLPRATTGKGINILSVTFSKDASYAYILYREEDVQTGQTVQSYKLDQWALPVLN